MKLEEVLPEMRKGRRARCKEVHISEHWVSLDQLRCFEFNGRLLLNAYIQGDWELEPIPPQKIEVTKKELRAAWETHVFRPLPYVGIGDIHFENLCRELGFNDET